MQKAFKALRARVLIVRYLEFQGYMSARPTRQRLTWGMYIATAFLIAAALFVCIFYGMSVVRVVCGWVCPALTLHVVPPGLCFLPEQALAWLRCFGIAVLIDILVLQPMKAMGFYLFWRVSQGEDPNAAKRDAEHAKLLDVTNFSHRDNPANGGGDGDGSGAQCRLYTSPPRCLDVHHVTRHHVALTWEAPDHIAVDRTCVPVVGCLWCWVGFVWLTLWYNVWVYWHTVSLDTVCNTSTRMATPALWTRCQTPRNSCWAVDRECQRRNLSNLARRSSALR